MIVIVDYNTGNLGSILNMFKKIGHKAAISADPQQVAAASKLVLPGVGAFDVGMLNLDKSGLIPLLNKRVVEDGVPTLGICLGMQLMASCSEEGKRTGLGWVDANVIRFQSHALSSPLKIPHMGWNRVLMRRPSPLTSELPDEPRFYFVHSYFVRCNRAEDVLLTTNYGETFDSAFQSGNVWGVQFHPEKSHKFGMALLRNFATKVH